MGLHTFCECTFGGPSDALGHSVLRKKELVSFVSVSNVLALPTDTALERLVLARRTSGKDLRKSYTPEDTSNQLAARLCLLVLETLSVRGLLARHRCTRLCSRSPTSRRSLGLSAVGPQDIVKTIVDVPLIEAPVTTERDRERQFLDFDVRKATARCGCRHF